MNEVLLIGRLGSAPEYTKLNETMEKANFSLATSSKWKDKAGNNQETTEWHRVICWGSLARNCYEYIDKGSLVAVSGSVQTRSYEKEEKKIYVTEIQARSVNFLDKKDDK